MKRIGIITTGIVIILVTTIYFTTRLNCHANISHHFYSVNHNYRLSWEDDFNGGTLDNTIWSKIKRVPWPWGCHMSDADELYDIRRGRLRLYCKVNDGIVTNDTSPYLTGGISSQNLKTIKYGKVEVRARIHGAQGTWPAIWMKPNDPRMQQYPYRAEIDIVELMNHDIDCNQTVHTNYTYVLKQKENPRHTIKARIKPERYNIYCVEILPEAVIFSVNGKRTLVYPKIETSLEGQYPFGVESFLMIDMQIGGTYRARHINPRELPAYIDIDWVRAYDLAD